MSRTFILCTAAAAAKSLQSCPALCDPINPTRLPHPSDSPGKNTGVGCHFLLQCVKVKSESEVAQLCLILSDSMDCSLLGSPVHGIFQARVLEWVILCTENAKLLFFYSPPCLQSFPVSEPFPVSWLFASGGQSIGFSLSISPCNKLIYYIVIIRRNVIDLLIFHLFIMFHLYQ